MYKFILVITGMLLAGIAVGEEKDINTRVDQVTIYHSGALVSRIADTDLAPGLHELVFRNVSSKIVMNSLKMSNRQVTVLNKSLVRKLTPEEFSQLLDRKEAITKQMVLIEAKFNETGFVAEVDDLERMTEFYSDKMMQLKSQMRDIDKQIAEAKKLEGVELKNEDAALLKLIVSVDGKLEEPLRLQYVCGGIGWSPAYEVTVNSSSDNRISMKYMARVMSQTGEDWDKVKISLSSSFPLESPTSLPRPEGPWVLTGRASNNIYGNMIQQAPDQKQSKIEMLEGVEYQEISIPSFLKLRTLKGSYALKSNSTVFTFPIQSVELPSRFYYFGYPSIDSETFLVAEITGWDTLGFVDGIANITYAGNDVGKSVIRFSESLDTLLLPVGKDNSVFLKRTEMADQKLFKESGSKKHKCTLAYSFELKNNNSFPVRFVLAEQIPIAQTKSAEVEMEKMSGGQLNSETGEVSWEFVLEPAQSTTKELVYTVEADGDYGLGKGTVKSRYKTISAPSF